MVEELTHKLIMIETKNHLSVFEMGIDLDIFNNDWLLLYIKGEQ